MKSCRVEDLTKGIYARLVDEKVKGQRERSIVEEEERALGDLGRERERERGPLVEWKRETGGGRTDGTKEVVGLVVGDGRGN